MKKSLWLALVLMFVVSSILALESEGPVVEIQPSGVDFSSWVFPLEYGDWADETGADFGGCSIGVVSCGSDVQCDLPCGSCGPRYFGRCSSFTSTCSCFPIEDR